MGKPMNLRAAAGLAIFLLAGCVAGGGPVHDANVQSTPLYEAALLGDVADIRSLLAGGANVNARAKDGSTPLHAAAMRKLVLATLEADAKTRSKDGATPLHLVARSGAVAAIRALLAGGAAVNARSKNGSTPLHGAALSGDVAAIRALLAGGADVSARSKDGITPLYGAALSGDVAAIRALLADGADANARSKDGLTPLHMAVFRKTFLAVLEADAKGSRDKLLKTFTAGFDETDREVLAVILKGSANDGAVAVHALLAGGAAVNARDEKGATPLHAAALSGDAAAVKALLDAGGDPNAVAFGCGPMDVARLRMENTETSIAPFRDSIEALRAAGARPRKGCRL